MSLIAMLVNVINMIKVRDISPKYCSESFIRIQSLVIKKMIKNDTVQDFEQYRSLFCFPCSIQHYNDGNEVANDKAVYSSYGTCIPCWNTLKVGTILAFQINCSSFEIQAVAGDLNLISIELESVTLLKMWLYPKHALKIHVDLYSFSKTSPP